MPAYARFTPKACSSRADANRWLLVKFSGSIRPFRQECSVCNKNKVWTTSWRGSPRRKWRSTGCVPWSAPASATSSTFAISRLTYTSNAIEGNTLSAAETTLVIEKGITIGGKPLKDHLEAIDHHEAIGCVRALSPGDAADRGRPTAAASLVVQRSHPEITGRYANQGRYVLTETGRHNFPSPTEVPALMEDLTRWLVSRPIRRRRSSRGTVGSLISIRLTTATVAPPGS